MEIKNVSVICLVLACVAFTSVQSASFYYRTGRELEVPVENEIIREEIVSELKREPEVIVLETEPIAAAIEEEIIIPVEQLRVAAPAIEVQEPIAVISEKEETNAVVEEAIAERSAGAEAEALVPVVVKEKIVSVPIVEEPLAVSAVEDDIPKTRNEPVVEVNEKLAVPVAEVQTEVKETPIEVVHVAVKSSPIEEAVVVEKETVIVAADPSTVEADEAIRQNEGDAAAVAPTTTSPTRPNVIQAITNQFQTFQNNFQNQIQSVFNPSASNAATAATAGNADSTGTSTVRPNIIVQFQQAVGQVFNRPAGGPGPFAGIASAVQNNFQMAQTNLQGLFNRPQAAAATPTTVPIVVAPVDPVAEKTMLGEVPVVNAPAEVVEKVEEKEVAEKEVKSD